MSQRGIHISGVSFTYPQSTRGLADITLSFTPGTLTGIVGSNGSGKTTLLCLCNGLIPQEVTGTYVGDVTVDDVSTLDGPVSYFARSVGLVMQDPDLGIFNLTVSEEVAFGMRNLGLSTDTGAIQDALTHVGLEGYEDRDPQTLSYGQKQRLMIAACIAMDTPYLVLDEPSAMLDYRGACELYALLTSLVRQGKSVIVADHDTDFILTYADHSVVLDEGRVISQGLTRDVMADERTLRRLGIKVPQHVSYDP